MELRCQEKDLHLSRHAVKAAGRKRTTCRGKHCNVTIAVLLWVSSVLGIALLMTGCSGPVGSMMIGDKPPRVVLSDLNGKSVTIPNDLKGRVAIVHFWADGCSSCDREMPAMQSLYSSYKDAEFTIVAVDVGQPTEAVKRSVRESKITYTVVLDQDAKVSKKYGVTGLPQTIFLDRDGIIRYKLFGEANEELLGQLVKKLL
jgi:cytochrome c biogenesis protein CcmG, thiol:disulfide interchange protein DsbE